MQVVRLYNIISNPLEIKLDVPQGSVFCPILFLIFINDLDFVLDIAAKLFADDTTIFATTRKPEDSLDDLVRDLVVRLKSLLDWCSGNRMDINWSKTFFMIVTAKHSKNLNLPSSIRVVDNDVLVTDEFKLLGVLIDNKLTFNHPIVNICKKRK